MAKGDLAKCKVDFIRKKKEGGKGKKYMRCVFQDVPRHSTLLRGEGVRKGDELDFVRKGDERTTIGESVTGKGITDPKEVMEILEGLEGNVVMNIIREEEGWFSWGKKKVQSAFGGDEEK